MQNDLASQQASGKESLLRFEIGPYYFCLPAIEVVSIIVPPPITTLPLTAPDVAGVFMFQNQIAACIDLRQKFAVIEKPDKHSGELLLGYAEDELVAFWVDHVSAIVDKGSMRWSPLPQLQKKHNIFSGCYLQDEEIILLTSIEQMYCCDRATVSRCIEDLVNDQVSEQIRKQHSNQAHFDAHSGAEQQSQPASTDETGLEHINHATDNGAVNDQEKNQNGDQIDNSVANEPEHDLGSDTIDKIENNIKQILISTDDDPFEVNVPAAVRLSNSDEESDSEITDVPLSDNTQESAAGLIVDDAARLEEENETSVHSERGTIVNGNEATPKDALISEKVSNTKQKTTETNNDDGVSVDVQGPSTSSSELGITVGSPLTSSAEASVNDVVAGAEATPQSEKIELHNIEDDSSVIEEEKLASNSYVDSVKSHVMDKVLDSAPIAIQAPAEGMPTQEEQCSSEPCVEKVVVNTASTSAAQLELDNNSTEQDGVKGENIFPRVSLLTVADKMKGDATLVESVTAVHESAESLRIDDNGVVSQQEKSEFLGTAVENPTSATRNDTSLKIINTGLVLAQSDTDNKNVVESDVTAKIDLDRDDHLTILPDSGNTKTKSQSAVAESNNSAGEYPRNNPVRSLNAEDNEDEVNATNINTDEDRDNSAVMDAEADADEKKSLKSAATQNLFQKENDKLADEHINANSEVSQPEEANESGALNTAASKDTTVEKMNESPLASAAIKMAVTGAENVNSMRSVEADRNVRDIAEFPSDQDKENTELEASPGNSSPGALSAYLADELARKDASTQETPVVEAHVLTATGPKSVKNKWIGLCLLVIAVSLGYGFWGSVDDNKKQGNAKEFMARDTARLDDKATTVVSIPSALVKDASSNRTMAKTQLRSEPTQITPPPVKSVTNLLTPVVVDVSLATVPEANSTRSRFEEVFRVEAEGFKLRVNRDSEGSTETIEKLVIKSPASAAADTKRKVISAPVIENQVLANTAGVPGVVVQHLVLSGDTLWHIAIRYLGDPYRYPQLVALSKITNPNLIYPGDVVIIEFLKGEEP